MSPGAVGWAGKEDPESPNVKLERSMPGTWELQTSGHSTICKYRDYHFCILPMEREPMN